MKKDKVNFVFQSKKVWRLPFKLIAIILVIFFAGAFLLAFTRKILRTSDYFQIKDIVVKEPNIVELSYLKGKNIFSLDLEREAGYILAASPNHYKVRLVRILPNRIFVDFIRRKPVALVKLYRQFSLDREGVLFNTSADPEELELPVILGLETKLFGPKPGRKYNIKEIMLALEIIREVKANRSLRFYRIKEINLMSPANASIFITVGQQLMGQGRIQATKGFAGLEVKIGQEDVKDKVAILGSLMSQVRQDLSNIKYIDLRFKEPVIKYK